MIKEHLSYRIELVKSKDEFESDQFARDFVHSLGFKTNSGTWSGIDLDSEKINDFIGKAKALINNDIARFDGYCTLSQQIIDNGKGDIDWYLLSSDKSLSIEDYGEITTCKADKMSPNVHIAHGWFYNIYLSEKFKDIVEKNKLIGIDFLWVKDIGKFQAQQWYIPVVNNALGRGIDHPWFDPSTLKGSGSNQPTNPLFRYGTYHFNASQIKKDFMFDKEIYGDIISLFDPEILNIISYRRFLRNFLPNTDFAYIWNFGEHTQSGKAILNQWGLCISKRAKEILINNKVITERHVEPICVYESLPENATILDGNIPYPAPSYSSTNIDIDILRNKLNAEWKKFIAKPKAIKKVTFKQALSYLLEAKRNRPEDFCKVLSKNELDKNTFVLPEYWLDILKKSNGGLLNYECELIPLRSIRDFNIDRKSYIQEVDEDYPLNLIHVATCVDGDWYSLLNTDVSSVDSKILRISHETCQPIEQWDSIAMFLFDMLTGFYD